MAVSSAEISPNSSLLSLSVTPLPSHTSATGFHLQSVAQNASFPEECVEARFSQKDFLPWDNPDNLVSAAVERFFRSAKIVLTVILFLIGGPANVINMAVFGKQGLGDRVNLCLFSLALADCLFLTASTLLHVENVYLFLTGGKVRVQAIYEFLVNHNFIVFMGLSFVSMAHSAIIACERCVCVFSPLKYRSVLRTKTMGFLLAAVYMFVLSLYFIVSFRYRIGCVYDPERGVTLRAEVAGQFYRSHRDMINFLDSALFGAGFPGGTMVVVLVATVLTAVKLGQVRTWRTGTSTSLSPHEVALTKMLVCNSVFFIFCIFPNCVFRVAALFLPDMSIGKRYHNLYLSAMWIMSMLTNFNAAFNLFIYYSMGSRYRQTFWALFTRGTKVEK